MNRLKQLRTEKEKTQQEMANAMNVTRRGYQKWENGESQIKPDKVQELADYFGVSTSVLLGYRDTTDSLGFRLWTLRNEKKLKVDEVAEKLHLSVDELKAIEKTDNATLGPSLAQDFAELYGVSVPDLLGYNIIETEKTDTDLILMIKKLLEGKELNNSEKKLAEKIENTKIPILKTKKEKQNKNVILDELLALRQKMDKMIEEIDGK